MDVTLARCIKAAVDCPGHPLVKVAGAYAGGGARAGDGNVSITSWENGGRILVSFGIYEILWEFMVKMMVKS
jgi:hypothetical protein